MMAAVTQSTKSSHDWEMYPQTSKTEELTPREDRKRATSLTTSKIEKDYLQETKHFEIQEIPANNYEENQEWYKLDTSCPSVTVTLPQPKEDENSTTYTETNIATTRKSLKK